MSLTNIIRIYGLIFILGILGVALQAQKSPQPAPNLDSLERLLEATGRDTLRLNYLNELAKAYLKTDPNRSIELAKEALSLAEETKASIPALTYRILGVANEKKENFSVAIDYFGIAIEKLKEGENYKELAGSYDYLGMIYQRMGNFSMSLDNYRKAEHLAEEHNLVQARADAYFGLARVMGLIENMDEQLKYYQKFLEVTDPNSDQQRMSLAYMMCGDIIRERDKQYDEAIDLYNKAFNLAQEINDSIFMALTMNHLAWAFYEKGELETSLGYYQKNLDISIPLNRQANITNIYGNIGNIYRDKKDFEKALDYYDKSIELSEEIGDVYNLSWIYKDISIMYASLGDYQKAYEYQKLHSQYSDSLSTYRYQSQLADARSRYESEKSKQELEIVSLKLRNNRLITYILGAAVIIILIIAVMLIQRNRLRSNQKIAAMNHRISELNQQNLRQQMNPHFIFNTLNSIQYYVFQNDKIAANEYMSKFATLMRKILDNSRSTTIPLEDELDALKLYLELESVRFKGRFKWDIKVDDEIDTLSYKVPAMLIQPYVENAITHGLKEKEGEGKIDVEFSLSNGGIRCTIKDDGIGRKRAMQNRRRNNSDHQSLGTTITESRLKLVNELYGKKMQVDYHDLVDDHGEPSGTEVIITIPIIT